MKYQHIYVYIYIYIYICWDFINDEYISGELQQVLRCRSWNYTLPGQNSSSVTTPSPPAGQSNNLYTVHLLQSALGCVTFRFAAQGLPCFTLYTFDMLSFTTCITNFKPFRLVWFPSVYKNKLTSLAYIYSSEREECIFGSKVERATLLTPPPPTF